MGVDRPWLGLALQPTAQRTLQWWRKYSVIQLNSTKFFKQTSYQRLKKKIKEEEEAERLLQQDKDPKHASKSTMDYFNRWELKGLPVAVTVFWPKLHWKSVDRLQKSSAHKTARESQRTRNLLQEEKLVEFTQTRTQRLLDDYKKCLQAVIAVKCSADFFLLRALFCLFFYYYFETVKDVN